MRLKKTADPAPILVALTSGVFKINGVEYSCHRGERIRSDHPLCRKYRHLFAADGLTDAEYTQARQAMLNAREAAA